MKISLKKDTKVSILTQTLLDICSSLYKDFSMSDNTSSILLNLSKTPLTNSYNQNPSDLNIKDIFSSASKRSEFFKYKTKPDKFPCICHFYDKTFKEINSKLEYDWYSRDVEWIQDKLVSYKKLLCFKGNSNLEILNAVIFYKTDLNYLKIYQVAQTETDYNLSLEVFNTISSLNINLIEIVLDINNNVVDIKIPTDFIFDELVILYEQIYYDFLGIRPSDLSIFKQACIQETKKNFYL